MSKNKQESALLCDHCQKQLDKMVALGVVSETHVLTLRKPRRVLRVNYPINRDSGETLMVEGFRVQYNDALGPTKGGIRTHQEADLEEVTELAFLMSLKTSLVGLPFGGAKGAIKIDPRELSKRELEQAVRGFVQNVAHFIGEDHDIPAPDVNTNADTMALMLEEYEKVTGHKSRATFTGKPFALGGSLGRETSTSKGGFYIIKEILGDKKPEDTTIAIQGFGNVGSNLAQMLHEAGYKVVAVSDSKTGLYDKEGLNIGDLIRFKKDGGKFEDRTENPNPSRSSGRARNTSTSSVQEISNEKLLELDVDILAPSALGGVITKANAKKIKSKTIVEMANGPVTPEADVILRESGAKIVPDILANSGGVIVSYFEWVQNKSDEQWTAKKVDDELKKKIVGAYRSIVEEMQKRPKLDMRSVCFLIAIRRILEAEE